MNPAIVIPAYSRPKSLQRLLLTLSSSEVLGKPDLIISLEGGANSDVIDVANTFKSHKFSKRLITHSQRMGLRKHIIKCGDLTLDYDSVIILEDDLFVDRYFYDYVSSAINFYDNSEFVAGISLYAYSRNEFTGLSFCPMDNGYSTYFMQIVSSWGQCWSRSQWLNFKHWYNNVDSFYINNIPRLPKAVKEWPESSWKKYFHGYIVETSKYFVFPYRSFSTNCSDGGGTHIKTKSSFHQVPVASPFRPQPTFTFCPPSTREVLYDSYMEPCGSYINRVTGFDSSDVECDMQGSKPLSILMQKKYAITTRQSSSPISIYSHDFRPPEINILFPLDKNNENLGTMRLTPTKYIVNESNKTKHVSFYSYYAAMNLLDKDIVVSVLKGICIKAFNLFVSKLTAILMFSLKCTDRKS